MVRKHVFLATASLLAGLVSITGFVPTASAQTPPNVPDPKQGLSTLLGDVSDILSLAVPIGPHVFVTFDPSTPVEIDFDKAVTALATVTVNCSGLFLPVKGLDGPRDLDITVTQPDFVGNVAMVGTRRTSTVTCDGTDRPYKVYVSLPNGSSPNIAAPGLVLLQADLTACDLTGCNRWSYAALQPVVKV